jgi:hypothetical protein
MLTPSITFAPAPSHTFSPSVMPFDARSCAIDGHVRLLELVAAADEVRVGGEEAVPPDRHLRAGEDLGVEADVDVVPERDVAVLAGQDGAAAEEDARCRCGSRVRVPLASSRTRSSTTTSSPGGSCADADARLPK